MEAKTKTRRLIVGISGASGAILGIRLLEVLRQTDVETHLVLSPAAQTTIVTETDWKVSQVLALADCSYEHSDIGAAIASGSTGARMARPWSGAWSGTTRPARRGSGTAAAPACWPGSVRVIEPRWSRFPTAAARPSAW